MESPLVSVICLCYNQARFIREAVESVLAQTYPAIQIIVVDDASTDQSVAVIDALKKEYPQLEILLLEKNVGNCAAFNKGLALAKGEFIIDLAADDILLPNRVAIGIDRLTSLGDTYGVHYSDAVFITETGVEIGKHADQIKIDVIPSGNIYTDVIEKYFISSPTMLIRKSVFEKLGGYDESLHYEDFDFWVRSARHFLYDYSDEVLVKKRKVKGSLSDQQFRPHADHWKTTYSVLQKAKRLNQNEKENMAFQRRLLYETLHHLKRFAVVPAYKFGLAWLVSR